jgi:hypothetical protein
MILAVSDIEAAREELIASGIDVSEAFHCETGTACRFLGIGVRVTALHTVRLSYIFFVSPDGSGWLLQEVTKRLPDRVAGDRIYASAHDLSQALHRAATAHGKHEARLGKPIPTGQIGTPPTWCANNPAKSCRNNECEPPLGWHARHLPPCAPVQTGVAPMKKSFGVIECVITNSLIGD